MLKGKSVNRDIFVRSHCAATLGMLMQKVGYTERERGRERE